MENTFENDQSLSESSLDEDDRLKKKFKNLSYEDEMHDEQYGTDASENKQKLKDYQNPSCTFYKSEKTVDRKNLRPLPHRKYSNRRGFKKDYIHNRSSIGSYRSRRNFSLNKKNCIVTNKTSETFQPNDSFNKSSADSCLNSSSTPKCGVNVKLDQDFSNIKVDMGPLHKSVDNNISLKSDENIKSKVSMYLKLKEEFYSFKQSLKPVDVIMDYRHQIQKISEDYTTQNLKKIKIISSFMTKEKSSIHKLHHANLVLQQQQFEKYVSGKKNECSIIHDNDIDEIIIRAEKIKKEIENECNLFQRTLPAYAYKENVLSALEAHEITIISSDYSYFFNIVLPLVVCNTLPEHSTISCESSNLTCDWVKFEINSIMKHNYNSGNIKILTENDMLNHLKSISFENNNLCIIYNLTLKRTVTSDLLLSMFRDLCEKKQCKLILLLSIFNDVKKFQDYFSNQKVFTLKVPKLILPIKTVWKREPLSVSNNYKEDVVSTALAIHILNEIDSGDVCAFLPSLVDAKSAMDMFTSRLQELNYDNVQCILLHENSCYAGELKQFIKGKRRMIFTTSCAEIMPLPTVRFIIDSGLTRDFIFDGTKNFDVLTTVFNSRAKSRLRKSLVGVYSNGICYRIYNKENFCTDMSSYELPDILTLNPFNTLITVFHHQPEKAMSVPFVQPLSNSLRDRTVKLLKNFNAIKKGKLTELGRKVVKLPYPARYSKLILQSIQWGFAYEAVILVAFFSIDSYVFKCAKNENDQQVVDAAKREFIQHESDALTFLYIYKCWAENDFSKDWCKKHHIEYDTLFEVKTKMSDICSVVDECINENISQEFSGAEDFASNILEMLFHCFADNLCVYSGHQRCGYRILSSRQTAFLHPSSVLSCKENVPQFIIFNKIVHTSRNFLFGITAIPEEMVYGSLTEKTIDYEYSDLFERSLVSGVIEPVSERLMKEILSEKCGKKLQDIEDSIKRRLNSDFIIVDPSAERGCIYIYALESVLKSAVEMVEDMLKSDFDYVINADQVCNLELKRGHITVPLEVKCMKGAMISSVKIKDSSSILYSNLDPQAASIKARENHSSLRYCINLTWIRRPCNGICYVDFAPDSFTQVCKLIDKNFLVLGTKVHVEVSKRDENELMLSDVPCDARAGDIEFALLTCLPGVTINKIELICTKPFKTTVKDTEDIKTQLLEYCDELTDLVDYKVIVPKPKNSDTIMTACINVFGSEDLTSASEILSNTMIQNFKVSAIPEYRCDIKSTFKVYKALETRFEDQIVKLKLELSKTDSGKNSFSFERDFPNEDLVLIKLFSNDIKIMKHLQKIMHELFEGEVFTKNFAKDIHKLFCHGGHMWLRTLEKSKNVHIIEDYNSKIIRVYGSEENCFSVKQSIIQFLEETKNEAVETVVLSSANNNRILLKTVIKEYGVDMKTFVELCQLRSAVLDIKYCQLYLHGRKENIDQAKDILNMLSEKTDSAEEYSPLSGGEKCPVCACPVLNLSFRLQHCGHLYCHECVLGLVEQAQFPIQCCAEKCSQDIVLDDIIKILGEDKEKMNKLLHSSLNDYLQKNQSEILYCPAPDCSMFGFKNKVSEKWMCPLCQNEICTKCNVVYHMGFTCDVYQGSKHDPNYFIKVWKKVPTECKECPKCKKPVEKNDGCDHMTCLSCKAHFCWVCVREFPSEAAVYNHIPFCDKYPK